MALAITVRVEFIDDKGKTSFTKVRVPNGFTLSQYGEFGTALAQLLTDISICRVTGGSLTFSIDLSGLGLRTVAGITADIAEKAAFLFNTAITGLRAKLRIPTFRETLVPPGSDAVDLADVDVAAFKTAMESGIVTTGGTISPTDDRENDITGLTTAREVKRRTLT